MDRHNHVGAYLTDSVGLFRVVRVRGREMLLEDSMHPELPLISVTAKELREEKWRAVKPLKEAA